MIALSKDRMQDFFDLVVSSWPFEPSKYPALAKLSEAEQKLFVSGHIMHHVNKSNGVISGLIENSEHGCELNVTERHQLIEAIRKQFINFARLADLYDLNPERIFRTTKAWVEMEKKAEEAQVLGTSASGDEDRDFGFF